MTRVYSNLNDKETQTALSRSHPSVTKHLSCHQQGKVSSYIVQYPVLSILHFTPSQTCSMKHHLNVFVKNSAMLQLMHEGCSYEYPPLSIARYSFLQLSELEQCRVNKLAQGFNTAAQDSNPGSLSLESKALPLSHSEAVKTISCTGPVVSVSVDVPSRIYP